MDRYAMMDPGDAGATRPQPVMENQATAAAEPAMGATMSLGLDST